MFLKKNMIRQYIFRSMNQHLIPQVYLRQFGFTKQFCTGGKVIEKQFVCVKNITKGKWEHREIGKFLSKNHIYTLEEYKEISKFIIENDLNGCIDKRLPILVKQLHSNELNPNIHMALAETTANFMARTNLFRQWVEGWFERENFRDFFDMTFNPNGYNKIQIERVFESYKNMTTKDAVNSLMVQYMNYASAVLRHSSIEVLVSNDDRLHFTSDNPVYFLNNLGFGEIQDSKMVILFALSPNLLLKFYCSEKGNIQRNIREITNEEQNNYNEIVPTFAQNFIISPIDIIPF